MFSQGCFIIFSAYFSQLGPFLFVASQTMEQVPQPFLLSILQSCITICYNLIAYNQVSPIPSMYQIAKNTKSLIITGASGVGKGTIIKTLKQRHPGLFELVLSFTTRPMRPKQKHGVDYYFVSQQQFDSKIPHMLQHKYVHKNWYGTSRQHWQHLLNNNNIPVLDVDIEGMLEIRQQIQCEAICLMPAGWDLLRSRLEGRKTQTKEVIDNRMKENRQQVQKMLSLKGTKGIHFVTNYQYQLTVYGIELWLNRHYDRFSQTY